MLRDTISGPSRATADQVLQSIRLEGGASQVWPVADVQPPSEAVSWGNITFVRPVPESGVRVILSTGFTIDGSPPSKSITVDNGRSRMMIDAFTGIIEDETTTIADSDRQAFDRFVETVVLEPQP